jgi:hypothetical protein
MEVPFFMKEDNREYALTNFRIPKCRAKTWKEQLGWPYVFPWRKEQLRIIHEFQKQDWETFVVQAIFGGGKTTMIIAKIFDLVMQSKINPENILICAFNVAIKNEIKKKVRILGKIVPRTFDSIVYEICKEMDYKDLKHPNFLEKRKFLFKNIIDIPPNNSIQFIFLDEAQDLERNVQLLLKKRFPNAKMVIVGDIFQSIQKEPRESLLWHLIDHADQTTTKVYKMLETPRVPRKILHHVQEALYDFYPEFRSTISGWTSSSVVPSKGIEWSLFRGYKEIYQNVEKFIHEHGIADSMILVFSSAITVGGKLGDVSRIRRHLVEKGFKVNSNHKLMRDDAVFLSTANSSKGLERKHVFCILSFPLELAFANFSSDVLMNLLTVALSRCKESVHFSLPSYMDRYSPILKHYSSCPIPSIPRKANVKEKSSEAKSFLVEEDMHKKTIMLQKEHSATEILQLQILSFQTKQNILKCVKKYNDTTNSTTSFSIQTEEEAILVGLIFETLILCTWKSIWPTDLNTISEIGHQLFEAFFDKIRTLHGEFMVYARGRPFSTCSDLEKIKGAIAYAKLYIAFHNKVFCRISSTLEQQILIHFGKIRHAIVQMRPPQTDTVQTQHKVGVPFIHGIVDCVNLNDQDFIDIYEIKVSKKRDWSENALLQAILYGICLHKMKFRVHLINVSSKYWQHYFIDLEKEANVILQIRNDIQLWNLNCYLSKNRTFHDSNKNNLNIFQLFFIDGRIIKDELVQLVLYEIASPTKVVIHFELYTPSDIQFFIEKQLQKIIELWNIQKIIVGRHIPANYFHGDRFRYLAKDQLSWEYYLYQIQWNKEIHQEDEKYIISWEHSISSTSLQICELCERYNFVL